MQDLYGCFSLPRVLASIIWYGTTPDEARRRRPQIHLCVLNSWYHSILYITKLAWCPVSMGVRVLEGDCRLTHVKVEEFESRVQKNDQVETVWRQHFIFVGNRIFFRLPIPISQFCDVIKLNGNCSQSFANPITYVTVMTQTKMTFSVRYQNFFLSVITILRNTKIKEDL